MNNEDRIDLIEAHLQLMKDQLDQLYDQIYQLPNSPHKRYILGQIINIYDLFPMFE